MGAAAKDFVNVTNAFVKHAKDKNVNPQLTGDVEKHMSEHIKALKEVMTGAPDSSEKFDRSTSQMSNLLAQVRANLRPTQGDMEMS